MAKTRYEFECEVEELLERACSDLKPDQFAKLLDSISMMMADYEE